MDIAALQGLLAAHTPADEREAEHLQRCVELAKGAGNSACRDHFVPGHFTSSGFVLPPEGEELLLIFHGKLDRWLQPGGHLEHGDADPLAGARREVAEEVGLLELELVSAGLFDVDVHEIPARRAEPAHEHFDLRFLFRARTRAVAAGSDARDVRWVAWTAVNEHESDASVMRAVEKLRRGVPPVA